MSELKDLIALVNQLVSKFDPTPILQYEDFPLRWEAKISIYDYDFESNILNLDKEKECKEGSHLVSIESAIEINKFDDGSYEFNDGAYMVETHSWLSKLNSNNNFPSLSLLNEKFSTYESLIVFLNETYR